MEGMLKHQKTPINRSLTKLDNEQNKHALIIHKSLLGYCGDKAVTFPASLALDILNLGIQHATLRNEIFLQAIKHTSGNPSSYGQIRAFHLICLCCDTFSPSTDFYLYVLNFLLESAQVDKDKGLDLTPIQQMASYCLVRIQAMYRSEAVNSIDVESIEAYEARLPAIASIYSPSEELLGELVVAPDVDVEALLILICQMVGIHVCHRSLLGLYAVTTKSSGLAPMFLLPDKDFYIGDLYQPPLCQKYGRPSKYVVKRKLLGDHAISRFFDKALFDGDESDEQKEALLSFTFSQVAKAFVDDQIMVEDHIAIAQLSAYHLATEAEFIPDRTDIAIKQGCLKFIPTSLRDMYSPDYWGGLVSRALNNCVNKSDSELKEAYLASISNAPMADMNIYMAVKGSGSTAGAVDHIPNEIIFGVNEKGISFFHADNSSLQAFIPHEDIRKISIKMNSVKFTADARTSSRKLLNGSTYDIELITPCYEEISQLSMLYKPAPAETVRGKVHSSALPTSDSDKVFFDF